MNDLRVINIAQIREFLQASRIIKFEGVSQKEKYTWMENTLNRFGYFSLRKKDKSSIKKYIRQMTGFSDSQLGKLIAKKKKTGKILPSSKRRHETLLRSDLNINGKLSINRDYLPHNQPFWLDAFPLKIKPNSHKILSF